MTIPDPGTLISTPVVEVLGWTLLHFVWQGALVATLLFGALWALQRYGPRVRYSVSLAALTALLALPVVTGVLLYRPVASGPSEAIAVAVPEIATEAATSSEGVLARADGAARETWTAQVSEWVHPTLPWVVFAWTLGVLVLGARWIVGARRVRRLRRTSDQAPNEWRDRLTALANRMGLTQTVELRRSRRIDSPMVSGWWRPVVLVPVGLLSGVPPRQVEALLLHELAHVRRHDVLVGHVQTAAETFLFFHPATWWVSDRVRAAREACCDDLAVRSGAERTDVARALAGLAERAIEGRAVGWAPAASGGSLLDRVRRLLSPDSTPSATARRLSMAAAVLLIVGVPLGLAACASQQSATEPEPSVEVATPAADESTEVEDDVVAIRNDSTERRTRIERGRPVEVDSLGEVAHVVRYEGRTDTLGLPPKANLPHADVTPPPLPFNPDSLEGALLRQLNSDSLARAIQREINPDSIERIVRMRIDTDSLARVVHARINPDSLERVIHMRINSDSVEREVRKLRLHADSIAIWHRGHADSLRRDAERIRERFESRERGHLQSEIPERLREQARHLREQAERLEEQAREMETHESPEEPDLPASEPTNDGGQTG